MQYEVAFDLLQRGYNVHPLLIIILVFVFGFALYLPFILTQIRVFPKVMMKIIPFVLIIPFIGVIYFYVYDYNQYVELANTLKAGKTTTVEGPIENFRPKICNNRGCGQESFTVNNVSFEYTGNELTQGFNRIVEKGGPLKKNMYLRIHYVIQGPEESPTILKLEIRKLP